MTNSFSFVTRSWWIPSIYPTFKFRNKVTRQVGQTPFFATMTKNGDQSVTKHPIGWMFAMDTSDSALF
jgi:hypothetical protein